MASDSHPALAAATTTTRGAWLALSALCLGFFMIMIDTTITSVAMPAIMDGLHTSIDQVVWVTSAYLLAYAVPLLITGRLGDRVGPKHIYIVGLVVFTGASAWCGFAGSASMLITARAVQGLGASMVTPQTMAVITRVFPPDKRGTAMGLWGAVAGVAMLVGPILGGVLVDSLGWSWIFFINIPVGLVAVAFALRFVPKLPTHRHRFDILGIVLSAIGMFCLVFGIQEGQSYHWGTISGPISVWGLIIAGIVVIGLFLAWQARNRGEPLVPLNLFRNRNFSLANVGISAIGFSVTSLALPLMFYAQNVRGLSPARAALLFVPMAVFNGGLAPFVGRLVDRGHPRYIAGFGFALIAVSLVWLSHEMTPGAAVIDLLLPLGTIGIANAFIWSPLSATATHDLPMKAAGAGAGIYNTTRQVGSVLGSAGIGVLMASRLAHHLPAMAGHTASLGDEKGGLPRALHAGYAAGMADSMLLPAAVLAAGLLAVLCFERPKRRTHKPQPVVTPNAGPASPVASS